MPSKAKGNDAPSFSGKARSRRDFLKLSGIGIAGVALLGGMTAFSLARRVDSVIASELGISPDNDGVTNRENLVKALSYDNRNVVFLPGDYVIDNSKAESERGLNDNFHIAIDWFEGELAMESGARFVFTDNTRRGFVFHAGNGAKFKGLSSVFQTPPERRVIPEECFAFHYLDNILVEDAYIDGSTSVGLLFYGCVEPKVYGARILNTMADGLHFADCQDSRAENIYTENTGDDGLAFINYAEPAKPDGSAYSGGYATNITVKDSKARGIVTIGQSGVTVDGFLVDGTNASGVLCAYDDRYKTEVPSDVLIMNGEIRNAGSVVDPAGKTGNEYGIEIDAVGSVEVKNVKVYSPATTGVSAVATREVSGTWTEGDIRLSNIEVYDAPGVGFEFQGTAHNAAPSGETLIEGTCTLEGLAARGSGEVGMAFFRIRSIRYGGLTSSNVSKEDDLRRAFWFQNNARIEGAELYVKDDQATPTSYKVVTEGGGSGTLGVVYDGVVNGDVEVENNSSLPYEIFPVQNLSP